jgi:hypothetical protein
VAFRIENRKVEGRRSTLGMVFQIGHEVLNFPTTPFGEVAQCVELLFVNAAGIERHGEFTAYFTA